MLTRYLLAVVILTVPMACGALEKEAFQVKDGTLKRGVENYTVRAIETPLLVHPDTTHEEFARTIAQVADVGANTVCFDLYGFSPDGKELSREAVDAVNKASDEIKEYRMSGICRVFAPNAPQDKKYRKAAVRAAAKAFKNQRRFVYWIDGPDCAALVRDFSKRAPDLAVAAPEGASIAMVTSAGSARPGQTILAVETVPSGVASDISLVLPNTEPARASLDAALADPVELQPWTPDNSILSQELRDEGWIALFDGKTFNGWTIGGNKDGFVVRDGTIEWVKQGGGLVRTRNRFDNFVLHFEWKIEEGGNSGIYLRAPREARQSRIGMEFQLQGDHGAEPDTKTTGALYDAKAARVNAGKPAGEWNTAEVTLDGNRIKAVLNGQVIHDDSLADNDKLKVRLRRGFIGLQDHGNRVAFRNIRLKPL